MSKPRILAFAGSARRDSYNKRLARIAAEAARDAGAETTLIDLAEFPLPLMNEDLERQEGPPENAVKLKKLFLEHDALLIASPEYNSSITPLLKNTIDWVSRSGEEEPNLAAYQGKVAALMSASPGGLGGMRALVHVRSILSNIGVLVLPDQVSISQAADKFNSSGELTDERLRSKVEALASSLVDVLTRLHAGDE